MIPQISLIMGPCAGGAVYSPAITDFIFMVKETSHMFITGPDVIKTVTGEEVGFEELGGAMSHNTKSGVAHFASEDEDACLEDCRYLLSFLPQNNLETPPRVQPTDDPQRMDPELDHVVPDNPNKPYDMRDVVRLIVDDGEFFEVHEHYAKNIICGFARLDGFAVGVVGNQPAPARGRARHRRLRQGRALRAHLRRVQHPAAHLRRRPRLPARHRQEWGGIIRHGAKLLYAFTEATVPKITVITRKAYGGAYDVMASKHCSRRLQLRLADGRGRGDGPGGRGQHHLPARHRRQPDAGGAPREADGRLQGALRQPLHGGRARLHRRRDRPARDAPEADHRAAHAADQARAGPASASTATSRCRAANAPRSASAQSRRAARSPSSSHSG